ncbi:MAG: lysine--tRNA ligase, partial [Caldilineaceae bacterium]|nr:lysine--tRNA ligase [Caldilineaceae bacterium]
MTDPRSLFAPENLTDQEQSRIQKLEGLRAAGIDPYPARVKRTHTIAEARAAFTPDDGELTVSVVGRVKSIRVMGKASFADIEDGTGRIQLLVRRDFLPDGFYNEVWKKLIDLGDFISVTGPLMVTKTGELSIDVREMAFASKTLKPMPDKWHGVRDPEVRYRRRYVDLLANEEIRDLFRKRAAITRALREYMDGEGFLEVETPILQPI